MKCLGIEDKDGRHPVLLVQHNFLFFRWVKKYRMEERLTQSYYEWSELPDYKIVPDVLSFQLSRWYRNFLRE